MSPDAPVPYWPAYLPTAAPATTAPYRLTPLAEAALAELDEPEAEAS